MPYHVEWRLDTSQDDFLSLSACKMEVILDVDLKCPNTFYFGLSLLLGFPLSYLQSNNSYFFSSFRLCFKENHGLHFSLQHDIINGNDINLNSKIEVLSVSSFDSDLNRYRS